MRGARVGRSPVLSRAATAFALVGGAALVAVGARVELAAGPVPTSLQTLAVVVVGGLLGPRRGAAALGVYLVAALAGLPVLADGERAGGLALLERPSLGYLLAFPLGAAIVGRWGAARPLVVFLAALAAHAAILALGGAVLALHVGPADAWSDGVRPFGVAAVAKSAAGAAVVAIARGVARAAGSGGAR